MKRALTPLWRALRVLGVFVAGLAILFEEWGWVPLARLLARLAHWPFVAWVERRVSALPPVAALVVFFVPMTLLLPVKLLAVWLIASHRVLWGLGVILAAKVLGTALVARLFVLTQPQLMRLAWFARLHAGWIQWKEAAIARVRGSLPWRLARALAWRWRRALRRA